jgi:hypothetical protein
MFVCLAQPAVDLPSVLHKEAIYCAVGRCDIRLKEVIPFQRWIESILLPEARGTGVKSVPSLGLILADELNLLSRCFISDPILKRRIAWLIGKWVSDMCSPANTPTIWEILLHLLHDRGPGSDCVVRLTAATAVRLCVDVGGTRQFQH